MTIHITRLSPRRGLDERPLETTKGYKLAGPNLPPREKHLVKHATFVRSIEDAKSLIENGYSIWMKAPGLRESLIIPMNLRIVMS